MLSLAALDGVMMLLLGLAASSVADDGSNAAAMRTAASSGEARCQAVLDAHTKYPLIGMC